MKVLGNVTSDNSNVFLLNGLKKRSDTIFNIPITMNSNYSSKVDIETGIEYREFATSKRSKTDFLIFKNLE